MVNPTVVMFGLKHANKFENTSVIVIQVSSETRRDWSPTLSQNSKFWQELSKFGAQERNMTILRGARTQLRRILTHFNHCIAHFVLKKNLHA